MCCTFCTALCCMCLDVLHFLYSIVLYVSFDVLHFLYSIVLHVFWCIALSIQPLTTFFRAWKPVWKQNSRRTHYYMMIWKWRKKRCKGWEKACRLSGLRWTWYTNRRTKVISLKSRTPSPLPQQTNKQIKPTWITRSLLRGEGGSHTSWNIFLARRNDTTNLSLANLANYFLI